MTAQRNILLTSALVLLATLLGSTSALAVEASPFATPAHVRSAVTTSVSVRATNDVQIRRLKQLLLSKRSDDASFDAKLRALKEMQRNKRTR